MVALGAGIKTVFYRVLLPLALLSASIIRPSFISLVYGFLGLAVPLFPAITTAAGCRGATKGFLSLTLICCLAGGLAQLVFQVFLVASGQYKDSRDFDYNCSSTGVSTTNTLFEFGLQKLPTGIEGERARVLLSDIIAVVFGLLTFIVCVVFGDKGAEPEFLEVEEDDMCLQEEEEENNVDNGEASTSQLSSPASPPPEEVYPAIWKEKLCSCLKRSSDLFGLLLICMAGTIYPSALNFVYFVNFLLIVTWWSMYRPLKRSGFNRIKMIIIGYVGLHMILLYLYQLPFFQTALNRKGKVARLIGLTGLVGVECGGGGEWWLGAHEGVDGWQKYTNPGLLLFLYFYLVLQLKATFRGCGSYLQLEGTSTANNTTACQQLLTDDGQEVFGGTEEGGTGKATPPPRIALQRLFSVGHVPIEEFSDDDGRLAWYYQWAFAAIVFFVRHSYAVSLITMIAWAVGFHSALAFVWLILSCLIWSLPNTQRICYTVSPFIVFYAEVLLLIQYFYSLDLHKQELPFYGTTYFQVVQDVGLIKYQYATCFPLWIKILFTLPYFVTMRLFLRDRFYKRLGDDGAGQRNYGTFAAAAGNGPRRNSGQFPRENGLDEETMTITQNWFESLFGKYWIYIVAIVLIAVSVRQPFTLFSVGYMAFFALIVVLLQVSFKVLRGTLFCIWSILLLYSGVLLSWLYVFQFASVCEQFKNVTTDANLWHDLGLSKADDCRRNPEWRGLFSLLLTPLACLAVVALQCKFFHNLWRTITDPQLGVPVQLDTGCGYGPKIRNCWLQTTELLWRFAEIHVWKLVAFSLIMLATFEVEAVNLVLVILVVLMLPGRIARRALIILAATWLSLVLLVKLLVQLKTISQEDLERSFMNISGCQNTTKSDENVADWIGFKKVERGMIGSYAKGCVLVLVTLGVASVVEARQEYRRAVEGRAVEGRGVVFPNVKREDADDGVKKCLLFLINYFFYKFGVEICFVTSVVVAAIRMDSIAFIYMLWVVILFTLPRRTMARVWYIYILFLMVLLPAQYAICVRIPCIPWPWQNGGEKLEMLAKLLFLPNNMSTPNAKFLIADFFQLLFACCQMYVFSLETSSEERYEGGENTEIWREQSDEQESKNNPTYDFVTYSRSNLDPIKTVVFGYFHWITLIMVFLAGLGAISLFALGYLIAGFLFLWKGNDLYVKEKRVVIRLWRAFVYYCLVVILMKVALQFVACVYVDVLVDNGQCWFVQLLSLTCLSKSSVLLDEKCTMSSGEADVTYDAVAFAFLMIQLRIIGSHYFRHVIDEFKAERILSSRGAVLINQLVVKEMKLQNEQESKRLVMIKRKADEIREQYERNKGETINEPQFYGEVATMDDLYLSEEEGDKPKIRGKAKRWPRPKSVAKVNEANWRKLSEWSAPDSRKISGLQPFVKEYEDVGNPKRAGDYYMFDVDPDLPDETELGYRREGIAPEPHPGSEDQKGLGPLELLHVAAATNLDFEETVKMAEKAEDPNVAKADKTVVAMASGKAAQQAQKDGDSAADFIAPPQVDSSDEETKPPTPAQKKKRQKTISGSGTDKEGDHECAEEEGSGVPGKAIGAGRFVLKFLGSCLDYLAAFFNRRSRDHRYVAFVLDREKKKLKEKVASGEFDTSTTTLKEFRKTLLQTEEGRAIHFVKSEADAARMELEADEYWKRNNVVMRFLVALGYLCISRTELLCYLLMFLNHMQTAAILSLPLPLLALFWGTLCSPRPPKFFWIVVIAYTEGLVVIKFLFQFHFFNWTPATNDAPFYPPRIIGIDRTPTYAAWDVTLLIMLFFHRYMMRRLGLWKDARHSASLESSLDISEPKPKKRSRKNSKKTKGKDSPAPSPRIMEDKGDLIELQNLDGNETHSPTVEVEIKHTSDEEGVDPPQKKKVPLLAYFGSCGSFYHRLLHPSFRYIRDLYPFIFLSDLICLLICTFGYNSFGVASGSGDVLEDVKSNRVPMAWVVMLITLVILIIIDRGLYLRKTVVGKLFFQYLLIIGVHMFIFFILPYLNAKSIKHNYVAQLWYFVKCVYFLFSAWQIRNGFPSQVIGNLLTKSYNLLCFALFSVYWAIPFLFEIRTLIDWIWTDTSMPLFDFFNMENFYATIYKLKCGRKLEKDFPAPRGVPKGAVVKYLMGGGFLAVIIIIIFLPLLLYSLLNYIGISNPPDSATFSISIQGYPPLYSMVAQGKEYLTPWSTESAAFLNTAFSNEKSALDWMREFDNNNIIQTRFRAGSLTTWGISDPAKGELIQDLQKCNTTGTPLKLVIAWEFSRSRSGSLEGKIHEGSNVIDLNNHKEICIGLEQLLSDPSELVNNGSRNLTITNAYPPYIHLPADGAAELATKFLRYYQVEDEPKSSFANITLGYMTNYWTARTVYTVCPNDCSKLRPECCVGPGDKDQDLQMVAFVDKLFPSWLSAVVAGGIIAMYLAVVLLVSRVIRGIVVGDVLNVIVNEMPYVDRVLKICLDIYLVREARDFILEQDLYAKLLFLFRSPETLIKWTRPKKIKAD